MPKKYTGEVVYIYAFDFAYEMVRREVKELLGQPVASFVVDASKRGPHQLFFYRPQMVRLPPMERVGPLGPVRVSRSVKLLPVGAISITVRVPFEVDRVEELVVFHDLEFSNGSLRAEVQRLADEVRRELAPYSVRPVARLADEEGYTVFCLAAPLAEAEERHAGSAEAWLLAHRREVAALLTQEPDIEHLSRQEAEESTRRFLSYYEHDLVVIDWDAALLADAPSGFDEVLYVIELANLQLAELEAYDQLIDNALDRAYRDLRHRSPLGRKDVLRELREIRVDLARFNDELSNITKFFGDWHLARIYQEISARFHLADWSNSVGKKLKTLDDLYALLSQERINQWMLVLEITIVLLFVIDLVMLFRGLRHA